MLINWLGIPAKMLLYSTVFLYLASNNNIKYNLTVQNMNLIFCKVVPKHILNAIYLISLWFYELLQIRKSHNY